jgi:hypothetical protein
MKHNLKPVFALAACVFFSTGYVQADTQEKMIIALKTDHFELSETDVSDLAIGESQTIETESGKVIDILRTVDGVDVFIDGELLELDFAQEGLHGDHDGLHEEHMIRKHVEVICDENEDCDKNVFVVGSDEDYDFDWASEDGNHIVIHKEVELSCSDDDEAGTSCSNSMVWISDDEEINLEELHEMHSNGEGARVIIIKKEVITED